MNNQHASNLIRNKLIPFSFSISLILLASPNQFQFLWISFFPLAWCFNFYGCPTIHCLESTPNFTFSPCHILKYIHSPFSLSKTQYIYIYIFSRFSLTKHTKLIHQFSSLNQKWRSRKQTGRILTRN